MKFFKSKFTRLPEHSKFEYTPRYYDAEKEEKQEREIRFGKATKARYSGASMMGKFRGFKYVNRERQSQSGKWTKMGLLLALMGVATALYLGKINGILAIGIILILLVLFIRETNKL